MEQEYSKTPQAHVTLIEIVSSLLQGEYTSAQGHAIYLLEKKDQERD
jgi:hypothetical protein